jgi:E3 ubiquitin-protein ligase HECTD2
MPSRALGKLLSSNNTKSHSIPETSTKKQRVRSFSEKRPTFDHIPPPIERNITDPYYTPGRKGLLKTDDGLHDTDDYGFPRVQTPSELQDRNLDMKLFKGRCRTCNKSYSVSSHQPGRCEQCHTSLGTTSGTRPPRLLSYPKTQETIRNIIDECLLKLQDCNLDSIENISTPIERPTRKSTHHNSTYNNQRRGSAPDTQKLNGLPTLPLHNPPQSMRRKSPGPIPMPGTSPSPISAQLHASKLEPPTPFMLNDASPGNTNLRKPITRSHFQPLLDYLTHSMTRSNLNASFSSIRSHQAISSNGQQATRNGRSNSNEMRSTTPPPPPPPQISRMDHKDLMIGDVYDVASSLVTERSSPSKKNASNSERLGPKLISQGSPHVDWKNLNKWFDTINNIGISDLSKSDGRAEDSELEKSPISKEKRLQILQQVGYLVRSHVLDHIEHLLLVSQSTPKDPEEIRYLLILIANPLLLKPQDYPQNVSRRSPSVPNIPSESAASRVRQPSPAPPNQRSGSQQHKQSRIWSLLLGLIANLSAECHHHLVQWLSRYPEDVFRKQIDVILVFLNARIQRKHISSRSSKKGPKTPNPGVVLNSTLFDDVLTSEVIPIDSDRLDDWQLRSACKVLQLYSRANDIFQAKNGSSRLQGSMTTRRKQTGKQLIPVDHFYIKQLDSKYFDSPRDFDDWERKEPGFQITQYPFLLPLGSKFRILEFDARKKMASKAREEFFDAILRHTNSDKFFHMKVRRKCVIEDSLQRISEAISSSEGEAKKALKVHFDGEDGIDAGGLGKEWFLLLVRELFDPAVGKLKIAIIDSH